jgi:Transglutaminase-like domain
VRNPVRIAPLAALAFSLAALASPLAGNVDSDAPDTDRPPTAALVDVATYAEALDAWRSVEDVNAWIGAKFEYDAARAMRLSETQRQKNGRLPIHAPVEFYASPKGVCVDLSRFGVETLGKIAPESHPRYLMIEFDPVTVGGNALRRHWVAAFERDGKLYFFADSKRPGHIAGPYESTQAFIDDYARYRGRTIVAFAERATYERTARLKR